MSPATPLFPRATLHPAVLAWADAHAHDDAPWCVAFSGGADSLALLITLCDHWPQRRATGKIIALHFNHHLRGKASDDDQTYCETTCNHLGITTANIGHWHHHDAPIPHSSEAEARKQRHQFFDTQMSACGATALWLGHQRDDIAETQLMRLARGSSTAGLAAPRPIHMHPGGRIHLRPLLTLTKTEITSTLRSRGHTWREDATNTASPSDASGDYYRNRIRRDVIPAWTAAAENDALAGAALTRELLDEDATALDAWLDELLQSGNGVSPHSLDLRPLANKPRALLRRALRRWPPAADLARSGFEALLATCETGTGRTSIGNATAILENGILRLEPPSPEAPPPFSHTATVPFTLPLADGATLTATLVPLTDDLRADILAGRYDPINTIFITPPPTPKSTKITLTIRSHQPGDRYQPLGAPGTAKTSDLLINRKIPHACRLTLPVICAPPAAEPTHDAILWIPGIPPADAWKITPQTQQALHLTYDSGTCTVRPSHY